MTKTAYTISEITKILKRSIEENPGLNLVWIKGEISNLTYHSSGHIYLSLKDKDAVMSAVFFKYSNRNLTFKLKEGMSILAFGSINIFEKRGTYQFIIKDARLEGVGELLKRVEQLKKKLDEEGIFDQSHKKKIPFLPKRIGIVTSPTGAAIRDIIKVAVRRFPNIEILLAPAKVQGADADFSIVNSIEELNDPVHNIDVIIAARGGGSFEDLMPFNEEIVVRAFYNSRVPIISAVGHQIDHPLSDDASDYAAPTPSAAAEIAIPVKQELVEYINRLYSTTCNTLNFFIRESRSKLTSINDIRVFKNPMEIAHNRELILMDIEKIMVSFMKELISNNRKILLSVPDIDMIIKNIIKEKSYKYNIAFKSIVNLSPSGILQKGYSITTDEKGAIIKSVVRLKKGDKVNVMLHDGSVKSTVNLVNKEARIEK